MELSKLQVIALSVLTTVLTDRFLTSRPPAATSQTPPTISPTPTAQVISNITPINSQNEIILREIINLRKDMTTTLDNLKNNNTNSANPVPTLSTSALGGMVKISSPQWKRVEVYEKPIASSKVVNNLVYDSIYFYRQKQNSWYQLDLDGGQIGWVQSQFLTEYP